MRLPIFLVKYKCYVWDGWLDGRTYARMGSTSGTSVFDDVTGESGGVLLTRVLLRKGLFARVK